MKIALVLLGLTLALPAVASTFSPIGSRVTLNGVMSVVTPSGTQTCLATWRVNIDAKGKAKVVAVSTGGHCTFIALGLPWTVTPSDDGSAIIGNVSFMGTPGTACGPGNLQLFAAAPWQFAKHFMPEGCGLNGTLISNPPVAINP